MRHQHLCACGARFNCSADVIDNTDGIPARYCEAEMHHGQIVPPACDECCDAHAEAQDEARREAYFGSSEPQTISEQSAAADQERRELRRRD